MIIVNLSQYIMTLSGQIGTDTLGQAVAEHVLARASTGNAMKSMHWARILWDNKPLSLDKSDFELFFKTVEDSNALLNFVKGPILEILTDLRHEGN